MARTSSIAARKRPGARTFGSLCHALQANPKDIDALPGLAQLALQVEFATIPVYLTGMYSIIDTASVAYQTLRSVVMEEMFHLNLAANLVVALGGAPRLTGTAAPIFPGSLPNANPASTPQIGLYRASAQVFNNVYAAIETPAPVGAPAQAEHYNTIAQLYDALLKAIDKLPASYQFKQCSSVGRQRTDIYLGKFGGKVVAITDKASARQAIQQIVQQGEGTLPVDGGPLDPTEPFATYNYYGQRTDGTYGPILGVPREMSHFIKFRQVALSSAPFPQTRPITSNPVEEAYTNPRAKQHSYAFNMAYSVMLRAFELSFQPSAGDPYFGIVLEMMHKVLPKLAVILMGTPAHLGGDADVGPNATPAWIYLPDTRLDGLVRKLKALHAATPANMQSDALDSARASVQRLSALGKPHAL